MCSWGNLTNFKETPESEKIFRFYVIETPVEGVSKRGKSFKQLGWDMRKLNTQLKKEIPILKNCWIETTIKDMSKNLKEHKIEDKFNPANEIFIHIDNKDGKTKSLFYAIRCSFAHGDFSIHRSGKENVYVLQNEDKGSLKARIVVKESTLLKMIEIVNRK